MKYYDYIIIGVSIALVLAAWVIIMVKLSRKQRGITKDDLPNIDNLVQAGGGYLTDKEYTFYRALSAVASSMGLIALPKVELCNIIFSKDDKLRSNKSFHRYVDFCVFSDVEFKPVLIVDLFDNTIADQSLFEMDGQTQRLVNAARIPVLKYETMNVYIQADLRRAMEEAIYANSRGIIDTRK